MRQKRNKGAIIAALAILASAGAAQAGPKYDFSSLKPLPPVGTKAYEESVFHDFRLTVTGSFNRNWNRGDRVPLERKARELGLGLQFRIGEAGFAGISGQFGREDIATQPVDFPLDMDNDVTMRGFDVMAGFSPMPGVTLGVTAGRGYADASYVFLIDPALTENRSSGNNTRFGGFAGLVVPTDTVTFTANAALLRITADQDYNDGNIPPTNSWASTSGVIGVGLLYPVAAGFSLKGDVAYTRILSESAAIGSQPRDRDWLTLKATALYDVNDRIQLQLGASTWALNDTAGNVRISTGLTYKF